MRSPIRIANSPTCDASRKSERPVDSNAAGRQGADPAPGREATAEAPKTRILLIERRQLTRECLTRCIQAAAGHEVIAHPSIQSWLDIRDEAPVSLALYCLSPNVGNDAADRADLHDLARLAKMLPTVALSDGEDLDQVLSAINRGARGFIPTSLALDVMIEALRLVRAGGVFVPAGSLIPALRGGATVRRATAGRERNAMFTARQAAVVEAIGKGKANKTIAHELNMRESTVKVHVRNIMKKLSAKNRTEVALMANRLLGQPASASS